MGNRADNFTRGDSATTLDPPSDAGSNWIVGSGTWGIATNKGYAAVSVDKDVAVLEASTNSADIQVTLSVISGEGGVCGLYVDDNNYIALRITSSGSFDILQKLSGIVTVLGHDYSGSFANNGDTIKLSVSGASAHAYYNGVLNSAIGTVTADSSLASATKHGLYVNADIYSRFSAFTITEIATGFSGNIAGTEGQGTAGGEGCEVNIYLGRTN